MANLLTIAGGLIKLALFIAEYVRKNDEQRKIEAELFIQQHKAATDAIAKATAARAAANTGGVRDPDPDARD